MEIHYLFKTLKVRKLKVDVIIHIRIPNLNFFAPISLMGAKNVFWNQGIWGLFSQEKIFEFNAIAKSTKSSSNGSSGSYS